MKRWYMRLLSAALVAALLLSGAALAEELPTAEEAPLVEEIIETEEPVEESVESVDAEVEETEAALEADVELEAPEEEVVETSEPLFAMEDVEESDKLMAGETSIPIDSAHFPDAAFRKYLSTHGGDGMGNIWPNTVYEITLFEDLSAQYGEGAHESYGVTSLQGIEYFTNLKKLNCMYNTISVLDVSMLKNLEQLWVPNCGLTSLNVSGCTSLWMLTAVGNKFTTLDISGCAAFAGFPAGYKRDESALKKQGYIIYNTGKTRGGYSEGLTCDASVTIVCNGVTVSAKTGKKIVPAVPASFAQVAGKAAATVAVDPASTAKNTKATALAAPGSAMQLNLGGATGKKFKSSKKKVATVNKNGVVTFKKGGKVKITYKVGKQTRKVTLTVIDPTMPTAIALNQTGTVAAKVGDAVTLTATMNEGAVSAIKWKTSNKKVATVKNGVVTFKKAGKVTITAVTKRGKKKAKVTYTVSKQ